MLKRGPVASCIYESSPTILDQCPLCGADESKINAGLLMKGPCEPISILGAQQVLAPTRVTTSSSWGVPAPRITLTLTPRPQLVNPLGLYSGHVNRFSLRNQPVNRLHPLPSTNKRVKLVVTPDPEPAEVGLQKPTPSFIDLKCGACYYGAVIHGHNYTAI